MANDANDSRILRNLAGSGVADPEHLALGKHQAGGAVKPGLPPGRIPTVHTERTLKDEGVAFERQALHGPVYKRVGSAPDQRVALAQDTSRTIHVNRVNCIDVTVRNFHIRRTARPKSRVDRVSPRMTSIGVVIGRPQHVRRNHHHAAKERRLRAVLDADAGIVIGRRHNLDVFDGNRGPGPNALSVHHCACVHVGYPSGARRDLGGGPAQDGGIRPVAHEQRVVWENQRIVQGVISRGHVKHAAAVGGELGDRAGKFGVPIRSALERHIDRGRGPNGRSGHRYGFQNRTIVLVR